MKAIEPRRGHVSGSQTSPLDTLGITRRRLPRHVAIIMDGNGRWARERGLPRIKGHEAGVESVRVVTEEAARLGISYLTLYAFSSQNWARPPGEVRGLMSMLRRFLVRERDEVLRNNIRLRAIGRRKGLPKRVVAELEKTERMTAENTGLNLTLALNYGGREEIVDAVRAIAREVAAGRLKPGRIGEATINRHLYTAGIPDPDLLIRTAGEMRVSNFLLWQISYAELYVSDVCWPDFRREHLHEALRAYAGRRRTFGRLEED